MLRDRQLQFMILALLLVTCSAFGQNLPVGSIVAYGGEFTDATVAALRADGWTPCDGRALRHTKPGTTSTTEYAPLFRVIGENFGAGYDENTLTMSDAAKKGDFNVPDCRGRFLRGVDSGTGRDADRGDRTAMRAGGNTGDRVGSLQPDGNQRHAHGASGTSRRSLFASVPMGEAESKNGMAGGGNFIDGGASGISRGVENISVNISESGGSESRPKNLYVNWIIRHR